MMFITPLLAGIAAAITIPTLIILYFLKLRRRTVDVSTTLLWKKAVQDLQANAPFQKLRRNILLFLQLLALGAALFGLAQPEFADDADVGLKRVILIDRSASMRASDAPDGKTRLEFAKEQAADLVESLREASFLRAGKADEAMVIAFDTTAEVRQTFTTDKAALRRAIEAIEPTDAPSSLAEAMRLARAHLPRRVLNDLTTGERIELEGLTAGTVHTHLFTDGRLPDAAEVLTQQLESEDPSERDHPVEFVKIGSSDAANVGIVGFSAEREYDNPNRLAIFVGLQNTAIAPRRVELTLLADGAVERVTEVTVPPAQAASGVIDGGEEAGAVQNTQATPGQTGVVFRMEREDGGVFAVSIEPAELGADEPEDVFAVDDRAWLVVPPARRLAAAFVTPRGNLFLQSALQGLPLARLDGFTPDEFQAAQRDGRAAQYDIVICDNAVPTRIDGQPGLPAGRFLIFGGLLPAPIGPEIVGEPGPAQFLDWSRTHPALRAANLDGVVITRMLPLRMPDGGGLQMLAETGRGPGIIEYTSASTRAILVPFDLLESNWAVEVSFVLFTASSVRYLGLDAGAGQAQARSIRPGEVLSDRVPLGVSDVRLELPRARADTPREVSLQPAPDGRIVFGPIRDSGIYRATWTGPSGAGDGAEGSRVVRAFAANLLDQAESDIPAADTIRLAATTVRADASGTSRISRRLWPYLLAGVLAVLLFEWWVYNRKVYL